MVKKMLENEIPFNPNTFIAELAAISRQIGNTSLVVAMDFLQREYRSVSGLRPLNESHNIEIVKAIERIGVVNLKNSKGYGKLYAAGENEKQLVKLNDTAL